MLFRSAAMMALNTASSANDFASKLARPISAKRRKSAKGVANQKKNELLFSLLTKGQKNPVALIKLVALSATARKPLNL